MGAGCSLLRNNVKNDQHIAFIEKKETISNPEENNGKIIQNHFIHSNRSKILFSNRS